MRIHKIPNRFVEVVSLSRLTTSSCGWEFQRGTPHPKMFIKNNLMENPDA